MKKQADTAVHAWLIAIKAFSAVARVLLAEFEAANLCESDFRVLEVLLHKGPLPVNVIGPKVNLTTGSMTTAIDRLFAKGLVTRCGSKDDRRVRIVALTVAGKQFITPVFKKHAQTLNKIFSVLSEDEKRSLEALLKKVGLNAERLHAEGS